MKKILYIIFFFISLIPFSHLQGKNIHDMGSIFDSQYKESATSPYKITSYELTINIQNLTSDSFVMIFDASGRNVYKQTVKQSSISIPVRSRGVYIIRIENSNKDIYTQKILVN